MICNNTPFPDWNLWHPAEPPASRPHLRRLRDLPPRRGGRRRLGGRRGRGGAAGAEQLQQLGVLELQRDDLGSKNMMMGNGNSTWVWDGVYNCTCMHLMYLYIMYLLYNIYIYIYVTYVLHLRVTVHLCTWFRRHSINWSRPGWSNWGGCEERLAIPRPSQVVYDSANHGSSNDP